MLGLFIVLPVFSVMATEYSESTPFLIGLALGIYGLFQALLQIPFGMLSDRVGRKPVILFGLCLFFIGSVIAALADNIYWVIAGRALQGAGAVSSALIALAADLSRDEQRTKMMAVLGASIGAAFLLSLVLGPVLVTVFSLSALFWFTAICAFGSILLLLWQVPDAITPKISGETVARTKIMRRLFSDPQLLRLNGSVFALHLLVTATFVGFPAALVSAGLHIHLHWQVYLPAMVLSVLVMIPLIIIAERYRRVRGVFIIAVIGLAAAQAIFLFTDLSLRFLFLGLLLFFCFFNTLEALLPSLVSKLAPAGAKGSATGVFTSAQFLGAFAGGVGGGWLYGSFQLSGLSMGLLAVCILWMLLVVGVRSPAALSSYTYRVNGLNPTRGQDLVHACMALDGVAEAVAVPHEDVVYLKVDRKSFDPEQLTHLDADAHGI